MTGAWQRRVFLLFALVGIGVAVADCWFGHVRQGLYLSVVSMSALAWYLLLKLRK